MRSVRAAAALIACALGSLGGVARADTLALRGVVYPGDGPPIADGGVLVEGGRVRAVGPWAALDVPADARVLALPGAEITPGLVDACSTAGVVTPGSWAEHGSEVVPHLRVLDTVDLDHVDFERLVRRGVTTVFVTGGPGSVVGSRGVALKTAGPPARRLLYEAGAVKANLGPEAWVRGVRNSGPWGEVNFATRRPTTLMGAVWVFREAFSQAATDALDGPAGPVLREVLAGKRSLRVQARARGEIEAAVRLTREMGLRFILEEGTEAYRLLDMLAAAEVPVIFGPLAEQPRGYRARTGEADEPCLSTPRLLAQRGITFCLSACDREDEDGTWAQGMLAVRYGLSMQQAVQALTATPATLLGEEVAHRVGRLAPGLDADVVVWSGPPFEATTHPVLVLVDGEPQVGRLPDAPPPGRQRFK